MFSGTRNIDIQDGLLSLLVCTHFTVTRLMQGTGMEISEKSLPTVSPPDPAPASTLQLSRLAWLAPLSRLDAHSTTTYIGNAICNKY